MSEKWSKIANEYGTSLFPAFSVMFGLKKLSQELGKTTPFMFRIERGASEYYTLWSQWSITHNELVKMIKNDPNYLRDVYQKIHDLGMAMAEKTKTALDGVNDWSSEQLNQFYQDFIVCNTNVYRYGIVLVLLDFQKYTFLGDEVKNILEKHNACQHFITLTTPLQNTYGRRQDLDLLKLFIDIKKEKIPVDSLTSSPDMAQRLKSHLQKYAWVYYVYEGPALNMESLLDMIRDLEKRGVDPEKKLANIEKERIELEEGQKKILRGLSLNDYEKSIIELARDAVFYKPYRRELQSWSYYHLEPVLKEIARRFHLTLAQVRMMLSEEVELLLIKDKVDVDLLNERLKYVVHGYDGSFFTYAGDKARKFVDENIEKEEIPATKKIKGTVAYVGGLVKGVVKIINSYNEIEKMEDGDILVSSATSPNLMPVIRKASAIVTDEGGLTCHASIVSRELQIPCVVGTKFATKILKDGQLVEVDAMNGIVRKL